MPTPKKPTAFKNEKYGSYNGSKTNNQNKTYSHRINTETYYDNSVSGGSTGHISHNNNGDGPYFAATQTGYHDHRTKTEAPRAAQPTMSSDFSAFAAMFAEAFFNQQQAMPGFAGAPGTAQGFNPTAARQPSSQSQTLVPHSLSSHEPTHGPGDSALLTLPYTSQSAQTLLSNSGQHQEYASAPYSASNPYVMRMAQRGENASRRAEDDVVVVEIN